MEPWHITDKFLSDLANTSDAFCMLYKKKKIISDITYFSFKEHLHHTMKFPLEKNSRPLKTYMCMYPVYREKTLADISEK